MMALSLVDIAMARHTKLLSGEVLEFLARVSILTGWGSLRGSLNLSTQI